MRHRLLLAGATAAAGLVLAACQTGERPSFDTTAATTPTSAAATSRIAGAEDLFDTTTPVTETATWEIRPTNLTMAVPATLTRDADRLVLAIRDVRYVEDSGERRTCRTTDGSCEQGWNAQPISDLVNSAEFWGPSVRTELASPAVANRIGPVTTKDTTVAGQTAQCVTLTGGTAVEEFCSLRSGLLASKISAEVDITLTSYTATFDETLWASVP